MSLLLFEPAALEHPAGLGRRATRRLMCASRAGAREPLYFNGARMVGNYPMSLVLDGQALNITLTSTATSRLPPQRSTRAWHCTSETSLKEPGARGRAMRKRCGSRRFDQASPVYLPGVKGTALLAGQLEHRSSWCGSDYRYIAEIYSPSCATWPCQLTEHRLSAAVGR